MMSALFEKQYDKWLNFHISNEKNPKRKELLNKGLSHSTVKFLQSIWFPTIGSLSNLYPEYEVRDLNNKYRYLDLAYMPNGTKSCIEIHDYRSHARDVDTSRFKDLCMKQAMLVLDDWYFLPIAYLSIRDDPEVCKQLVLSFVGKFLSVDISLKLTWAEAETIRYARRVMRAFEPRELADHLLLSENRTRVVLRSLLDKRLLIVASGIQRYRTYQLSDSF
ncbi:transcriptional regulator [Paenibacillus sp. PL2-23]|uniref:transcriptional regulator n=1 Tax=Paenibacillus sp. PL2-23 TaxID=2100729 RepID=UPI0030FBA49C